MGQDKAFLKLMTYRVFFSLFLVKTPEVYTKNNYFTKDIWSSSLVHDFVYVVSTDK